MNPTALTAMVDRVFDDRYRIEEIIGVGAISAVFSAFDRVEDRWVALKVFDAELADDEFFVERLLEAAEQASLLVHPNIATVLDWGDDGGAFIVSELCEGGSLAALLEEGHRLAPSQALVMTLECSRALNFGHEQGTVHRSIHPRNVLFTSDQQIRIADYGLAGAIAEAPAAQPSRALENVRYASPEQARGRPVGEPSDVYSLALVVNEAVSGSAPRVSETVVDTLMDRAESTAELDPALGGLLGPLERCGRVDPAERPEADELAIALLAAAESMSRPQALPLVGIGNGTGLADAPLLVSGGKAPTTAVGPLMSSADLPEPVIDLRLPDELDKSKELDELSDAELLAVDLGDEDGDTPDEFDVSVLGDLDDVDSFAGEDRLTLVESAPDQDEVAPALSGLENLEQAEPVFAEVPGGDAETSLDVPTLASAGRGAPLAYEELPDDADDRLPWWPLLALVMLVAALVAGGVYLFAFGDSSETATAPDLIGVSFDDVGERLGDRGWDVIRLDARVDGAVVGTVVAQDPAAGEEVDPDQGVTVTVSLGNEMVEVPSDIVGLTIDQAESRLGTVGLLVGRLSQEASESLAAGLVIGLDEPTTQMPTGEGVALRVSAGPEDRVVPSDVVGSTIGDATSLLVGLRLQAVEEPTFDPEIPAGTVMASIPIAGEIVPADSVVTLIVSAGPEPVEMPDIIGLQLDEAVDVITELGLIFIDSTGTPGEDVIGSLPPIGAVVDVATEVTIILAEPDDDEEANDG